MSEPSKPSEPSVDLASLDDTPALSSLAKPVPSSPASSSIPSSAPSLVPAAPSLKADANAEGAAVRSKATTPRRLLEEDEPIGAAESTQMWFSAGAEERLQASIRLVAARPWRQPFSHATQKTAEALCGHISSHLSDVDVSLQPCASSLSRRTPAFWFVVIAALLLIMAPLQPPLCLLVSCLLVVGGCCEFFGVIRFSRFFSPPRAGYCVDVKTNSAGAMGPDGEPQITLLLYAAIDTPPADFVYHPASYRRYLMPLYHSRMLPALCIMILLLITSVLMWWWWISPGSAVGRFLLVWAILMALVAGVLGWFFEDTEEQGVDAAAVAVAIETFQRLQKLDLPYELRLVLAGASHTHAGIESWLRQRTLEERQRDTLMLCVMPLGRRDATLAYGTHQGLLWSRPIPVELARLGDWTSARLTTLASEKVKESQPKQVAGGAPTKATEEARAEGAATAGTGGATGALVGAAGVDALPKIRAQTFHGSTPALWVRRFGVEPFLIGDVPSMSDASGDSSHAGRSTTEPSYAGNAALSMAALDAASAFLVALTQAYAHEREAATTELS